MAVDERSRHALAQKLDDVLGPELSETMMELLDPPGRNGLATRQDLEDGLNLLRTEHHTGIVAVRGEMAELGSELRGEMAELGTGLRGEMGELADGIRGETGEVGRRVEQLRGDLLETMQSNQRLLLFGMVTTMFTLAALFLAVAG